MNINNKETMKINITAIVAQGMDRQIGMNDGKIPWPRLKGDMTHFKRTTVGHTMIMGRKTFDSFDRKPLPGRTHVVVSRSEVSSEGKAWSEYSTENADVICAKDPIDALSIALKNAVTSGQKDIFVIGGGEIYKALLDCFTKMIITLVPWTGEVDVYFPKVDFSEWDIDSRAEYPQDISQGNPLSFIIETWVRV